MGPHPTERHSSPYRDQFYTNYSKYATQSIPILEATEIAAGATRVFTSKKHFAHPPGSQVATEVPYFKKRQSRIVQSEDVYERSTASSDQFVEQRVGSIPGAISGYTGHCHGMHSINARTFIKAKRDAITHSSPLNGAKAVPEWSTKHLRMPVPGDFHDEAENNMTRIEHYFAQADQRDASASLPVLPSKWTPARCTSKKFTSKLMLSSPDYVVVSSSTTSAPSSPTSQGEVVPSPQKSATAPNTPRIMQRFQYHRHHASEAVHERPGAVSGQQTMRAAGIRSLYVFPDKVL